MSASRQHAIEVVGGPLDGKLFAVPWPTWYLRIAQRRPIRYVDPDFSVEAAALVDVAVYDMPVQHGITRDYAYWQHRSRVEPLR